MLFHGYSVENLCRLIKPLFYDDLTLADVQVKVNAEKKQTAKDGKPASSPDEAARLTQAASSSDLCRVAFFSF